MSSFDYPEFCANLNREQILTKLRTEKAKALGMQRRLIFQNICLKKYKEAPFIEVGANGGWWFIKKHPKGKGSVKKKGIYIRDPFQGR